MRESIVGFKPSIAASSESPIGPWRTIVNSTEVCVGVSSEPALVVRRRLRRLMPAARQGLR